MANSEKCGTFRDKSLWNVTRAEVVGEQVEEEAGATDWNQLWRKGTIPLRISVWGPREWAGTGGRYWRF